MLKPHGAFVYDWRACLLSRFTLTLRWHLWWEFNSFACALTLLSQSVMFRGEELMRAGFVAFEAFSVRRTVH